MNIAAYFASLNPLNLIKGIPGSIAQGIVWGLMALGVYITFRLLDIADLTVDGSFTTGGACTAILILAGWPAWAALLAAMGTGQVVFGLATVIIGITLFRRMSFVRGTTAVIVGSILYKACIQAAITMDMRIPSAGAELYNIITTVWRVCAQRAF